MADKEIVNTVDLEDRLQTIKEYLTMNRKTWTKTYLNHSFLTVPSTTPPVFLLSIRKPVHRPS